jgi:hypothetical protein
VLGVTYLYIRAYKLSSKIRTDRSSYFCLVLGLDDNTEGHPMAGIFRSLKLMLTGDVLRRIDTEVVNGSQTISLRLKREKGSGIEYVVLGMISAGNYQYSMFELDEFDRFIEAAKDIRAAAAKPRSPPASDRS